MKKLLSSQWPYFWSLISKRVYWLLGSYLVLILVHASQLPMRISILRATITGPDFTAVQQGYPYLPPFWLLLLILPAFIVGDSFKQLWVNLFIKVKGYGYTKRQFGFNNLVLMSGVNFGYVCTVQLSLFSIEVFRPKIDWQQLLTTYLNFGWQLFWVLMLLALIQQFAGWIHPVGLLFLPIVLLTYTVFMVSLINPINLTMWPRLLGLKPGLSWLLVISDLIIGMLYVGIYGKYEWK